MYFLFNMSAKELISKPIVLGIKGRDEQRIKVINNYVADKYGVTVDDIMGSDTSKVKLLARHMCMYLAFRSTRLSNAQLAEVYGKRSASIDIAWKRINSGDQEIKNFVKWAKIDLGYE